MTVVVFGGTGHYGQHIVKSLMKRSIPTRIVTRNRNRAVELFPDFEDQIEDSTLEIFEGDILSDNSIKESLNGTSVVIMAVSAFNRKLIKKMWEIEYDATINVMSEAKKQGISRLVYISVFYKPDPLSKIPQAGLKFQIEEAIEKSELNYTIFGASPSMEIFFAMIRGEENKTMMVPGGGPDRLPNICAIDLGEIVAESIDMDLPQRRYRMVGPDVISFVEAADRISKVIEEPIKFRKIPLIPIRIAAFITGLLSYFMPFISKLMKFIILLNTQFTSEIADQSIKDHEILVSTFDYEPVTLEKFARIYFE